ncbi:MAG: hypothetical protein IJX89_04075 [Alphaproteobacteria bacterium]|nr:hypothetical protein [Alphaproteobacteria bacterium]
MSYEYKKSKGNVLDRTCLKLSADLCCDGCDEKCKVSLSLQVQDQKYKPRKGSQKFVIKPVIYVGDKQLYEMLMVARVNPYATGIEVCFNGCNAKMIYQNALYWCRKTCKHSKLR